MITSVAPVLGFVAGIPWGPVGIAWAHVWSVYLLLVPKLYWSFKRTPISVGLFFSSIAQPQIPISGDAHSHGFFGVHLETVKEISFEGPLSLPDE